MDARITDEDLTPTGPGTIAGRFMRKFWQPVARCADLEAGHARPMKIMGEEFTLYRGETGKAHAVGFRCSHRGVQLSTGFVEGDTIRCLYHGWRFDSSGDCVERPGGNAPTKQVAIRSIPTEEYLGLVFVYLGDGDPPPMQRYPLLEGEGLLETTLDVFPCNYFRALENDAFHLPFTHRDIMAKRGLTGFPEVWGEETDWGLACYEKWPGKDTVGVTHKGMPNVSYIVPVAIMAAKGAKHAYHVSWRVPVDDDHHMQIRTNLTTVTPEEGEALLARRPADFHDRSDIQRLGDLVLAGKIHLPSLQHTHIEAIQDYVAQVGMGPDSLRQEEHLTKSDTVTVLLRRIVKRELQAIADGQPIKHWAFTDAIAEPLGLI